MSVSLHRLEEGNKVICRGILAMLSHEINGNSNDKLVASQQEITDAFKEVVALYMEWHNLPAGEQADTKQEGNGGKN